MSEIGHGKLRPDIRSICRRPLDASPARLAVVLFIALLLIVFRPSDLSTNLLADAVMVIGLFGIGYRTVVASGATLLGIALIGYVAFGTSGPINSCAGVGLPLVVLACFIGVVNARSTKSAAEAPSSSV